MEPLFCFSLTQTKPMSTVPIAEAQREAIDALTGPVLLEFGTDWCEFCLAAQPHIAAAINKHPAVQHLKITDGRGQPLGRSYAVKLWPTLVFLKNGCEIARVVRPETSSDIETALQALEAAE